MIAGMIICSAATTGDSYGIRICCLKRLARYLESLLRGNARFITGNNLVIVRDGGYTSARNQMSFKYKGTKSIVHEFVSSMNKLKTFAVVTE